MAAAAPALIKVRRWLKATGLPLCEVSFAFFMMLSLGWG